MEERPAWLEALFKSSLRLDWVEGAYALFRQRLWKEWVLSRIEGIVDGAEILRRASLEELASEDLHMVSRALMCLIVVGLPSDIGDVERLLDHPQEYIRKAARTCRFELKQKEREERTPMSPSL
jgi:hypothetical protein